MCWQRCRVLYIALADIFIVKLGTVEKRLGIISVPEKSRTGHFLNEIRERYRVKLPVLYDSAELRLITSADRI
jgi:hypothetical protein